MDKIKLLYLVPSLTNPGGMERILTEKMNYLVDCGKFDVHVISTEQLDKPPYFDLSDRIRQVNFRLNFNQYFNDNIFLKYLKTKDLLIKYRLLLEKYISKHHIDICISLGGKELEFFHKLNVSCKRICEMHFGQNIREQFLVARSSNVLLKVLGRYRTRQLISQTRTLDKLVVLTKADEAVWRKTHSNVLQIYNFSALDSPGTAPLSGKQAIAVGRLDVQKGFDLLIDAWLSVAKVHPDWTLNIFGTGEWQKYLGDKIDANGLSTKVYLRGVAKDVQKELLDSSLFILSSRYEGFPMVLLESIACGVPIVAFDCQTGPSEVILNDDCGRLVVAEDVSGLSEAIIGALSNRADLKVKGLIAKERSLEFSKETIMQHWIRTFEDLKLL